MTTFIERKIESLDDPGSPSATARALDTPFVPSASKYVMGMYTVEIECDEGESGSVELRSDAANPPLTVRASAKLIVASDGDSGSAQKVTSRQQLTYVAQPGHYVSLVSAGTGAISIAHQTELAIS